MTSLLRFEGVALRRGGRLLFENLDLELQPGDALQVTGPNGSGKSSLLRLAAGLLQAERGTVERSPLALADDNLALDRERTLRKALWQWLDHYPLDRALEIMGIEHLARVPVRLLSTGQARKAALARVIGSDASVWLLDEPLNGLDADGAWRLETVIGSHIKRGGAVLAASHQPLPGVWRRLELGT
ncbi:MAG TPA: heme ABC exporter ATP-binding protein CcmA [Sphingomicrobium sp.]